MRLNIAVSGKNPGEKEKTGELQVENNRSDDGPKQMGNSYGTYTRGPLRHWLITKGVLVIHVCRTHVSTRNTKTVFTTELRLVAVARKLRLVAG